MEAFYTQFIQETFDETGQITLWGNDVPTVWPCCGGTTGARKNG